MDHLSMGDWSGRGREHDLRRITQSPESDCNSTCTTDLYITCRLAQNSHGIEFLLSYSWPAE